MGLGKSSAASLSQGPSLGKRLRGTFSLAVVHVSPAGPQVEEGDRGFKESPFPPWQPGDRCSSGLPLGTGLQVWMHKTHWGSRAFGRDIFTYRAVAAAGEEGRCPCGGGRAALPPPAWHRGWWLFWAISGRHFPDRPTLIPPHPGVSTRPRSSQARPLTSAQGRRSS